MLYLYIAIYLIALVLLVLAFYTNRSRNFWMKLSMLLLAGLALSYFENFNTSLLLSGTVIFAYFALTIGSVYNFALGSVSLFYVYALIPQYQLVAQAMLLGMLAKIGYIGKPHRLKKKSRNIAQETNRDLLQMALGTFLLVALAYAMWMRGLFEIGIIGSILVADITLISPELRLSKAIASLERKGEPFGKGAYWLALGTLLALGFIQNKGYLLNIFTALFISDSLATILGIRIGNHALPYNINKSIEGTSVYFVSLLVIGYAFSGMISIAFAIIGALLESISKRIDDNFLVSLGLVCLALLLH